MSTADFIALGALIVLVLQSGLLWWYASETKKIRLDAAAQNLLIAGQLENATKQNELIGKQLETMNSTLQLQMSLVEASETAHYTFRTIGGAVGYITINATCISGDIAATEYRSNQIDSRFSKYANHERNDFAFQVLITPERMVYFGIKYKTKRGETKSKVFKLDTRDCSVKDAEPAADINLYTVFRLV
jgi:hypothetical protein